MATYYMESKYSVCVLDVGSPKLGNLGWSLMHAHSKEEVNSAELDDVFPHIKETLKHNGLIFGLEAPLFVPLRPDLLLATKARKGEGRRPWSAGAGAQVLAMNLPIMIYLMEGLKSLNIDIEYFVNEDGFKGAINQIMFFEALVSGQDKGTSHIHDAQIMTKSCFHYAEKKQLPTSILEHEPSTTFFNLAGAALLRCGLTKNLKVMEQASPIYKP